MRTKIMQMSFLEDNQSWRPANNDVFLGVQLAAEMKKIGHKVESKDTATISATANVAQKSDGVLRSQKENVPR